MRVLLPKFRLLRTPTAPSDPPRTVVFVHGIFSSFRTFDRLVASFASDPRFDTWRLAAFDYDWGEPILESAARLRRILNARYPHASEHVTLVGHSMGGLVSRFALIGGDLPCVKRIVMLGTPNFGALSAGRLSTLWQVVVAAAGSSVVPFFPRKAGLRDLTRPQELFFSVTDGDDSAIPRAIEVEYITVPGMFYHGSRRDTDPGPGGVALPFTIGTLVIRVLSASPFTEATIERPHDGIVEEDSVNLNTSEADLFSEKKISIQDPAQFGRTYGHIRPRSALECSHMTIQADAKVADAIKGILMSGDVVTWAASLSMADRTRFNNDIP